MIKNSNFFKYNKESNEDYSSEDYSSDDYSSEEERKFHKKMIPASQRLKDAIKQRQQDRKKGTKKEKINYDE